MFKEFIVKTLSTTIILCVAVASGTKYFSNTMSAIAVHKHQTEVAMTQYLGK